MSNWNKVLVFIKTNTHNLIMSLISTSNLKSCFVATCEENGITYQDGDIWNPYFPKFGVLKCQNCTCRVQSLHSYIRWIFKFLQNGTTYCEKLPCPPVRQCTDDDPVEETIVCCPKCTRSKLP